MSNPPRKARSLSDVINLGEVAAEEPAEVTKSGVEPAKDSGGDLVGVLTLMAEEDRTRLKQLALDARTSVQKLGHEAWNMMLQSRGLPPLSPKSANLPSGRKKR